MELSREWKIQLICTAGRSGIIRKEDKIREEACDRLKTGIV